MIQNSDKANQEINKKDRVDKDYGGHTKYCKFCGKQLIFVKTDHNGNVNQNRKKEWEASVCHKCWPKEVRRRHKI
jgi:hypothetical protein